MEFAQESLINEVLRRGRAENDCVWPRRKATADRPPELATLKSRLKSAFFPDLPRTQQPRLRLAKPGGTKEPPGGNGGPVVDPQSGTGRVHQSRR